jgi:hypothetical protein
MAKATAKNTEEPWAINVAFHYLVKEVGLTRQAALRQLTEKIQKGRLPVWVNGHATPRPDWMAVALIDEEAQILSTGPGLGWDPTAYAFFVASEEMLQLWPSKSQRVRKPKPKHKVDRVIELFDGPLKGKIKPGMLPHEAHEFVRPLYKEVSRDTVARALKEWQGEK